MGGAQKVTRIFPIKSRSVTSISVTAAVREKEVGLIYYHACMSAGIQASYS